MVINKNSVREAYANDESGSYGFSEQEKMIIAYRTHPTLSWETFEEARLIYEQNPVIFEERFGFKPESGRKFPEPKINVID